MNHIHTFDKRLKRPTIYCKNNGKILKKTQQQKKLKKIQKNFKKTLDFCRERYYNSTCSVERNDKRECENLTKAPSFFYIN